MKTSYPIRAALAVAILGLATSAVAQVSADKVGKSTSGSTPSATPVSPGAPGQSLGNGATSSDTGYTSFWNAMDANKDGKVTRGEYLTYHCTRWDKADTKKQGWHDEKSMRSMYLEQEMSKTDGQPRGTPLNPATPK